jgi:hypothetical protein
MPLLAVLEVLGWVLFGGGVFADGVARLFETEVFKSWYFGSQSEVVDPLPLLSPDIGPLFMQYQQNMDMLHQFDALLRSAS